MAPHSSNTSFCWITTCAGHITFKCEVLAARKCGYYIPINLRCTACLLGRVGNYSVCKWLDGVTFNGWQQEGKKPRTSPRKDCNEIWGLREQIIPHWSFWFWQKACRRFSQIHFPIKAGPPSASLVILANLLQLLNFVWKTLEKNRKWHHFCAYVQRWLPWSLKNVEKCTLLRRI